jgi:hypothetical protein
MAANTSPSRRRQKCGLILLTVCSTPRLPSLKTNALEMYYHICKCDDVADKTDAQTVHSLATGDCEYLWERYAAQGGENATKTLREIEDGPLFRKLRGLW